MSYTSDSHAPNKPHMTACIVTAWPVKQNNAAWAFVQTQMLKYFLSEKWNQAKLV